MSERFVELQKALDQWWNDYNHLLGDASGNSECRRRLKRIVDEFAVFQRENAIRIEQIKDEKDTKIGALQLAILTIYKPKIEKLERELKEERKCNKIKMGAMLKALEQKHRELEGKISIDKKQLQDIIVGHCSGYYHCNRSSYGELKRLLAEDSKETT